jgi:DNA polymerase III delta subunit
MRYQNFRSFQKHLASAAPDRLCRCYLAMVPDDYERAKVIRMILAHFQERPQTAFNGEETECRQIVSELLSPSLFGGEPVVVLDQA